MFIFVVFTVNGYIKRRRKMYRLHRPCQSSTSNDPLPSRIPRIRFQAIKDFVEMCRFSRILIEISENLRERELQSRVTFLEVAFKKYFIYNRLMFYICGDVVDVHFRNVSKARERLARKKSNNKNYFVGFSAILLKKKKMTKIRRNKQFIKDTLKGEKKCIIQR